MAGWGQLEGAVVGVGVGTAAGVALEPVLEPERQKAWSESAARLLELDALARLVAQGLIDVNAGIADARRQGFTEDRFRAAVQLALVAAPVAELLELWRRGKISEQLVDHGLAKAQVEPHYWPALKELANARLQPPTIALAVQRGVMRNATNPETGEPLLPVGPTSATGVVAPMPVSPLDPLEEAKAWGYDFDRLAVDARNAGLSPAPGMLLDLLNRGVIEPADYFRGVSEGDTRNEWARALLELRHLLIAPETAATLRLKGWIDRDQAAELGARRGASPELMDQLYLAMGRPAAPGQMFTMLARGTVGPDGSTMDRAQFLKGIRESDIRPEWGEPLYAIRHQYPPLFQLTRLVASQAIDAATAADWATKDRYAPEVVTALRQAWQRGTGTSTKGLTAAEVVTEYEGLGIDHAAALTELASAGVAPDEAERKLRLADDRRVKRARDAVLKKVHDLYIVHELDRPTAAGHLDQLGISPGGRDNLLAVWDLELVVTVKLLTPAQIKKAAKGGELDRATALAELEARGYSPADAAIFLDE